jgi:hypothetical protein
LRKKNMSHTSVEKNIIPCSFIFNFWV